MQVEVATYGQAIMNECVHMEVVRLPIPAAHELRNRMGAPYESKPNLARWAGVMAIPVPGLSPMRVPFELVVCQRGASIRCHWSQVDMVKEIMDRMVPEIIVDVVPQVIRVG